VGANKFIAVLSLLVAVLLYGAPAEAQQPRVWVPDPNVVMPEGTRSWVSGLGDDANPCLRDKPCKTFAGAISKTDANGEINVLDAGGYGGVTITKSISIVAVGTTAGIVTGGFNGIVVNAGTNGVVNLSGLDVYSTAEIPSRNGVRIVSAALVHIDNCTIRGFLSNPGLGIDVEATTTTQVVISNCTISGNLGGVLVKPAGTSPVQVLLDRVHLIGNATGVRVEGNAIVRLNRSAVTANKIGLETVGAGQILSFGNNIISGNATNGTPSDTIQLK
jgi:hypothetical protein